MIHRFGPFEADPERYELRREGRGVSVEPQVLDLILFLCEHGGLVTKDELVASVWKGRFITDAAVARAVQKARRVLDDDAQAPRYIETVHGRGYRFVGASNAETLGSSVEASPPPPGGDERMESSSWSPRSPVPAARTWLLAIAGLVVLVLALWIGRSESAPRGAAEVAPNPPLSPERRAVLVLAPGNLGPRAEDAWLATALQELIAAELAQSTDLRLLAREGTATLTAELALPASGSLSPASVAAVRARTGATAIVAGSYLTGVGDDANRLRVDVALYDAKSGETLSSWSGERPLSSLSTAAAEIAGRFRRDFNAAPAGASSTRAETALPADLESARQFSLGLAALRAGDPATALPLLRGVVASSPRFALGYSVEARILRELGEESKARAAAAKAVALASGLPRQERLEIEGGAAALSGEWRGAAEAYTALWKFYPDELDYGLALAEAQTALGRADEAAVTVEALRQSTAPDRPEPRIDLAAAAVAGLGGDGARQRELAAAAAAEASAQGSRHLEAQALLEEGLAWMRQGEAGRAIESFTAARQRFERMGDANGVATAIQRTASVVYHQGQLDDAERMNREALLRFDTAGRRGAAAVCTMNLALIAGDRGDVATAEKLLLDARGVFRELGDRENSQRTLFNLISMRYGQGDAAGAMQLAQEGLQMTRQESDRGGQAEFLFRMGEIEILRGRLADAADDLERALAVFRELGSLRSEASALNALGSVRSRQGRLEEAARMTGEALDRFRRLGDAYGVADALNRTANTRYAQGRFADALDLHRKSLDAYQGIHHRFGVGVVHYGIATDLLAAGEPTQAVPEFELALTTFRDLGNHPFAAEALRSLAEVDIARGDFDRARKRLDEAETLLADRPMAEIEIACDRTSAQLLLESGDAAGAEALARRLLPKFAAADQAGEEAGLRDLLASALLEQGRVEEARTAVGRALELTQGSEQAALRVGIEITAVRVLSASGEGETAAARLDLAADRARELGLVVRGLEADLARAELLGRAGDAAEARVQLAAVSRAAQAHGLGMLVRRAARLGA